MRILVSNDDGFYARGIQVLVAELRKFAEVIVISPDRNRSAASSSLTLSKPLRIRQLADGEYCVNGTPADCVYLALHGFLSEPIDLVISGINEGCNMGDDTVYSGTLAAALEGRYLELPAIAISLDGNQYFNTAAQIVCELIPKLHSKLLNARNILNINVPDLPYDQLKGIKVCHLGYRSPKTQIIKQEDPRGENIYWIGPPSPIENDQEGTDFCAVKKGYVAITPIQVDVTAHNSISALQDWLK